MDCPRFLCAATLAAFSLISQASSTASERGTLATLAERSGYARTGRYEEVERLCPAYAARWPQAVRCVEFGRTPQGRPMLALVASHAQGLTPQLAHAHGVPVLFIQGGIHAGEIDGKDAGFLALRQILDNQAATGALDKITVVFVPVFNVDGHERFGHWNRPNQVGPEEMGWRVTAQNLNLNRDYMKADAPEMAAMLKLLNEWDPILYVDLHVTDGSQYQYEVSNIVEPALGTNPPLQPIARALLEATNERVTALGDLPLPFLPVLRDSNDPASGFAVEIFPPRFSTAYWAQRNRLGLLVETHSWKNYKTRVAVTRDIFVTLAELTADGGRTWLEAAAAADRAARSLGGTPVALAFAQADVHHSIDFKGYAYTRTPSAVSGSLALQFDPGEPQIWHVPLYDQIVPAVVELAPTGGYVVPRAYAAWVAQRLALHGIEFHSIQGDLGAKTVEEFHADEAVFADQPFEGRMTATLSGKWAGGERGIAKGDLYVPIAQAKARLVMDLLEPRAPDSFAAWGFFNASFEAKEYMEDYVAEQVGKQMLAARPDVAAAFRSRLANDPKFAADPRARLEFFYRRHPSWDDRSNVYPVMRVARGVVE